MKYTLLALSIYLLETCTMNGDPGEAYLEFDRAQEYQMSKHGDIYGIYPSPIDSNMITNDTTIYHPEKEQGGPPEINGRE